MHPAAVAEIPLGSFFEAVDDTLMDAELRKEMKRMTKRYVKGKDGRMRVVIPVLDYTPGGSNGRK